MISLISIRRERSFVRNWFCFPCFNYYRKTSWWDHLRYWKNFGSTVLISSTESSSSKKRCFLQRLRASKVVTYFKKVFPTVCLPYIEWCIYLRLMSWAKNNHAIYKSKVGILYIYMCDKKVWILDRKTKDPCKMADGFADQYSCQQ